MIDWQAVAYALLAWAALIAIVLGLINLIRAWLERR